MCTTIGICPQNYLHNKTTGHSPCSIEVQSYSSFLMSDHRCDSEWQFYLSRRWTFNPAWTGMWAGHNNPHETDIGLMMVAAALMISMFPGGGENSKLSTSSMSVACISSTLTKGTYEGTMTKKSWGARKSPSEMVKPLMTCADGGHDHRLTRCRSADHCRRLPCRSVGTHSHQQDAGWDFARTYFQ